MPRKGPARWPHLEALCEGYLHQDLAPAHGSAATAVRAYLADADRAGAVAVSSEWRTFLNLTSAMDPVARASRLRDQAGGAWAPATPEEFEAVSTLLLDAWRRG